MYMYTCRYEWIDVGMLDYDPDTKLYLVKRVNIPNFVLEANARRNEQLSQKAQIESSGSTSSIIDKKSVRRESMSVSSDEGKASCQSDEDSRSSGSEGEAGPASDGERRASQPQTPTHEVNFTIKHPCISVITCTICTCACIV